MVQWGAPRTLTLGQCYPGLEQGVSPSPPSLPGAHISSGPEEGTELELRLCAWADWVWKHLHSKKRRTWKVDTRWPKMTCVSLSISVSSRLALRASPGAEGGARRVGLLRAQGREARPGGPAGHHPAALRPQQSSSSSRERPTSRACPLPTASGCCPSSTPEAGRVGLLCLWCTGKLRLRGGQS